MEKLSSLTSSGSRRRLPHRSCVLTMASSPPEDTALIKPMRDYVRDFAILNTGGKAVIMNLKQPDLSKAIMAESDFELLYRNEWVEVAGEDGRRQYHLPRQSNSSPSRPKILGSTVAGLCSSRRDGCRR